MKSISNRAWSRVSPRLRAITAAFCLLASASLVPAPALAQDLDAAAVLDNVQTTFEALEDMTFLLTGFLVDPDGTEIPLEIEVAIIPDARVASAYIIQPDALADNIIVWSDQVVYNYIYLTNQVTVFDANDPDALGGIFGQDVADNEQFEATLDLGEVFDGFDATIEDYVDTAAGPAYVVRFENLQEDANIAAATATILDGVWLPRSIELFSQTETRIATLVFENVETGTGLAPDAVTYVPEDAEVIDERE